MFLSLRENVVVLYCMVIFSRRYIVYNLGRVVTIIGSTLKGIGEGETKQPSNVILSVSEESHALGTEILR